MELESAREPTKPPISIDRLAEWAETNLDFSARTIRWYAAEGLIPKAIHEGREAFFQPVITSYLWIIYLLQKDFKFKLSEIRHIIKNLEEVENSDGDKDFLMRKTADSLLNFYKEYTIPAELKRDFSRSDSIEWQRHNLMAKIIADILKNNPSKIKELELLTLEEKVESQIKPVPVNEVGF